MIKFVLVIREPGRLKPDYSLDFEAPTLPRVDEYISVQRPDHPAPYGEDMIVRAVWWRLDHPETGGFATTPKTGTVNEIYVEAEPALSPWSSDDWRRSVERSGAPEFQVARMNVGESRLKEAQDKGAS